jgi:predicted transcriptional regulator
MSEQQRDESGEFSEKVTDQDVLKAFDAADAPFMTAGELASVLPISRSGMNQWLRGIQEAGLVGRKETGARAVGWWARVAPRLSPAAVRGYD